MHLLRLISCKQYERGWFRIELRCPLPSLERSQGHPRTECSLRITAPWGALG
jgi:hypothetical protein